MWFRNNYHYGCDLGSAKWIKNGKVAAGLEGTWFLSAKDQEEMRLQEEFNLPSGQ